MVHFAEQLQGLGVDSLLLCIIWSQVCCQEARPAEPSGVLALHEPEFT